MLNSGSSANHISSFLSALEVARPSDKSIKEREIAGYMKQVACASCVAELEKEGDVTRTVHVLTDQECQVSVVEVLSLLGDDADGHNDSGTTPKIPLTLTYVMG